MELFTSKYCILAQIFDIFFALITKSKKAFLDSGNREFGNTAKFWRDRKTQ